MVTFRLFIKRCQGLHFNSVPEYLSSFFRGASCSFWKVSWICNTRSVLPQIIFLSFVHLLAIISDEYRLCNAAPENEWNKVLLDGLTVGKGDVAPDDLYAVINKRIERVLIRTVRSTNIWFLQVAGTCLGFSHWKFSFLFLSMFRKVVLTSNAYLLSI